jgi:hypothetical protein
MNESNEPILLPPDIEARIEQDLDELIVYLKRHHYIDIEAAVQDTRKLLRETHFKALEIVRDAQLEKWRRQEKD